MTKSHFLDPLLRMFVSRDLGQRDLSVDALRGFAVAGMILVNHGPPESEIYGFLVHSRWIGWTVADTIFPLFLFLVGFSISYSGSSRLRESSGVPYARLFRRTLLLILVNIVLVNFPYYEIETLVLTGTLSRIAYCYLAASLISYHCGWKTQMGVVVGILLAQWWFLTQFDVPGFGPGVITIQGNASTFIDNLIFGSFTHHLTLNGPIVQGFLPSASAVASTLTGVLVGRWINPAGNRRRDDMQIFAIGLFLFGAGSLWGHFYPVSKYLWTGSYVVLMTGLSMLLLAFFNWLTNARGLRIGAIPLQIAGTNALFFYVFAQALQRVLVYGRIEQEDGTSTRLRYIIYNNWLEPWADGKGGALLYALVFLAICYVVVLILYKRRVFIKL